MKRVLEQNFKISIALGLPCFTPLTPDRGLTTCERGGDMYVSIKVSHPSRLQPLAAPGFREWITRGKSS